MELVLGFCFSSRAVLSDSDKQGLWSDLHHCPALGGGREGGDFQRLLGEEVRRRRSLKPGPGWTGRLLGVAPARPARPSTLEGLTGSPFSLPLPSDAVVQAAEFCKHPERYFFFLAVVGLCCCTQAFL